MSATRKCIVWDLDNTLWDGVCLEGTVALRHPVIQAIRELDGRGILHSIASRGDEDQALSVLEKHDIARYFLVRRINWLPKSQNVIAIAKELDISLGSIAFVDDDEFEREQMAFMLPDVLTVDARGAPALPKMPEFSPGIVTKESQGRRRFYRSELERRRSEGNYPTREEFLLSCAMRLTVRPMNREDIPRVLELMTRTHQLNTTGWVLTQDALAELSEIRSGLPKIFVAELDDKYGPYGIIGTAIVETGPSLWRLKYLAVSCRVLGRGIERAFLVSLLREARDLRLACAEAMYRDTGRNRMMRALYQMMAFRQVGVPDEAGAMIFRARLGDIPHIPRWVEVR